MRKSLDDEFMRSMLLDIKYPNRLPDELIPYHCYLVDGGHCILCIPKSLYAEAKSSNDYDGYECPIPVKYVLEHGYQKRGDYLIVDVSYSQETGAEVEDKYFEYWRI